MDEDARLGSGAAPNDHQARRHAARLTSILGIAFAVLFLVGLAMLARTPGPRSTDQELATFYASGAQQWLVLSGLYVLPLAAVAFLWFIAALRQWVELSSRKIDRLLATVQMLSGVGFITLAFAAAGAATVVASSVELANLPVDPAVARQFPLYSRTLLIIFGMRMAAIFVTTTAKLGHEARLLPRWFVIGSYGVAAALFLVATLNVWLVVVFPLWVLVLNGIIWLHTAPRRGSRWPRHRLFNSRLDVSAASWSGGHVSCHPEERRISSCIASVRGRRDSSPVGSE